MRYSLPAVFVGLAFLSLVAPFAVAELVSPDGSEPLNLTIRPLPLEQLNRNFAFAPRRASFSEDLKTARCNADPSWNKLEYTDRAGMIDDMFRVLLKVHQSSDASNPSFKFSSRILTCKVFNESSFDTNIASPWSTAVGLSQVLDGTAADVLSDRNNFRSKVRGYEHIGDYATYKQKMAQEVTLQLEMSLAVMEMKRKDFGLDTKDIRPFLRRYLGSKDEAANTAYADSIYNCAACVARNSDLYDLKCLCMAKPNDSKCISNKNAPIGACR